jgi:hypothetical protein
MATKEAINIDKVEGLLTYLKHSYAKYMPKTDKEEKKWNLIFKTMGEVLGFTTKNNETAKTMKKIVLASREIREAQKIDPHTVLKELNANLKVKNINKGMNTMFPSNISVNITYKVIDVEKNDARKALLVKKAIVTKSSPGKGTAVQNNTAAAAAIPAAKTTVLEGEALMMRSLIDKLKEHAEDLDLNMFDSMDMSVWIGFGMKNSHIYRAKLEKAMLASKLTDSQRFMVYALAVAIKSQKRIMDSIDLFENKTWVDKVKRFYKNKIVQYTHQETADLFAVVHIPSCNPSLAMYIWSLQNPKAALNGEAINNFWFAQLNISDDLAIKQKAWEEVMWKTKITKGSVNFEKEGFNLEYHKTKSADCYPLMNSDNEYSMIEISNTVLLEYSKYITGAATGFVFDWV